MSEKSFFQLIIDKETMGDFKIAVATEERNTGNKISMTTKLYQLIKDYNDTQLG